MLHIQSISLPFQASDQDIRTAICTLLHIPDDQLLSYQIDKKSLDARKTNALVEVYSFYVSIKNEHKTKKLPKHVSIASPYIYEEVAYGMKQLTHRPVVIGFGPAGMFCALELAKRGFRPMVFERGSKVTKRTIDVERYWNKNDLNTESNVQFGEGGAGTFSDGKLTTRIKDKRVVHFLDEMIALGAEENIRYLQHPHIGTDRLRKIVKNLRHKIEAYGGTVYFDSHVKDIKISNGRISAILVNDSWIDTETVVFAIGHSADDTYHMLYQHEVLMESKPFAIGARIEHLQDTINRIQWKQAYGTPSLPAAEYRITHTASNGKGVYSFCMCPGGVVVAGNNQDESIVTNGMSYSQRDLINANSAILVQVNRDDFGSDVFDGLNYQKKLEQDAYVLAGSNKHAPCQKIMNYLYPDQYPNEIGKVQPSYPCGVTLCDLHSLFSDSINEALTEGLKAFEKAMPGFVSEDAILTAVESRSSAPIRVLRDFHTLQSNIQGIYPCGEGAGYAGGIVSSAIDGIKVAECIISQYQPIQKEEH